MKSSCIVYRDGSKLPLEQLAGEVSASLFQTDLHYGLCGEVARLLAPDAATIDVLHNLLSLKSRLLMGVTALLEGAGRSRGAIHRVVLPAVVLRVAGERLRAQGMEVEALPHDVALVPRKVAVSFFLKAVLHRCTAGATSLLPDCPVARLGRCTESVRRLVLAHSFASIIDPGHRPPACLVELGSAALRCPSTACPILGDALRCAHGRARAPPAPRPSGELRPTGFAHKLWPPRARGVLSRVLGRRCLRRSRLAEGGTRYVTPRTASASTARKCPTRASIT